MKLNISAMKLIIKLTILLILFVMLFMISSVLYSAKYWPDVYNYINANITIKRIPTISELNLTVYQVDYTTDGYTTTDGFDYNDASTTDDDFRIVAQDFTDAFEDFDFSRKKRYTEVERMNDYSEIPTKTVVVDYFFDYEESTKYFKDLIDESKLNTRDVKDVEIVTGSYGVEYQRMSNTCQYNASSNDLTDVVFPWIATIFIKNDTNSNQFEYYCDGALLSDQVIVTAGRCVINAKGGVGPDDFIVVLGKRSLQSAGDNEKAHKLKEIRLHENFTNENGKVQNDLAILVLEEPTVLNRMIIPSCIGNGESEEVKEAFTTGWGVSGALTPIHLDTNKLGPCDNGVTGENIFCGTYVNDVTVCPSYGGVYAAKQSDTWYLQGVLFGDPARRGICIDKTIAFTSIKNYTDWINEYIKV